MNSFTIVVGTDSLTFVATFNNGTRPEVGVFYDWATVMNIVGKFREIYPRVEVFVMFR